MKTYTADIIETGNVTHDVKRFRIRKPPGYSFTPGQATDVSINAPAWKDKFKPFTFTGLNSWDELEFTIKIYEAHNGFTKALNELHAGDSLIIGDPWGAISYRGPGTFIAGGAGITPFLAIFRQLRADGELAGNQLVFSNKFEKDIILRKELSEMLGDNMTNVITRENIPGTYNKRINQQFLNDTVKDFKRPFYVCGPDAFVVAVQEMLLKNGAHADALVIEK